MITLKTITTIELSSKCNLKCLYCVNRLITKNSDRKPQIMSKKVFDRSLYWLEKLCQLGTQKEVNLNGNGESTLDPDLIKRIHDVRDCIGANRQLAFCTNGINMNPELANKLRGSGINRVDVSPHSPYHARKAISILVAAGHSVLCTPGAIIQSHNWAGQLEPEHQIPCRVVIKCDPLIEGRGYIQAEGTVSPCCYDYRNLGTFGTVFDKNLLEREIKPYELCKTCHQKIPNEIIMDEIVFKGAA